jgi:peptidoglycan hydrolase CwlO-like protein
MPRYGLRTLLILTTVVAAFFGGRVSLTPAIRERDNQRTELQRKLSAWEHKVAAQQEQIESMSADAERLKKEYAKEIFVLKQVAKLESHIRDTEALLKARGIKASGNGQ